MYREPEGGEKESAAAVCGETGVIVGAKRKGAQWLDEAAANPEIILTNSINIEAYRSILVCLLPVSNLHAC
jgi:hypothetical protein